MLFCKHCKQLILKPWNRSKAVYCSINCQVEYEYQEKITAWKAGLISGSKGQGSRPVITKWLRRYMLERANFACEECGFDKRHPVDGAPIVQVDHIDGDPSNNSECNLRVLCPNCHALTHTYGGRNKKKVGTS